LKEPLGVVGQIIPWNFPLLMAAWKLAPALAAGNCVVLKPAEQTPATIMLFAELAATSCRRACSTSSTASASRPASRWRQNRRIAKVAFTGETTTGRLIMQYASENLIPVTLELGGKSPNIFFADVLAAGRRLPAEGARGLRHVRAQPGRGLHLPVARAGRQEDLRPVPRAGGERAAASKPGDPLDTDTMRRRPGLQRSAREDPQLHRHRQAGGREGAHGRRARDARRRPGRRLLRRADGLRGPQQDARVPGGDLRPGGLGRPRSTASTTRSPIANDTLYGLGAGVWTRDFHTAFRAGRAIQAGRVWTNCYHLYPAHAAFGGYKQSGIGRETHKMMLDHYQQTKNLLVSYDPNRGQPMGFF
jgi:aldehyde dehydrogenase